LRRRNSQSEPVLLICAMRKRTDASGFNRRTYRLSRFAVRQLCIASSPFT
jgi:hypothetical protein